MEFHYTPTRSSYAQRLRAISESFDFPTRVALKFKEFPPQTGGENITALDIGCATGASSLEMSKYFDRVVGIDYSETFVHLAQEFVRKGGKSRSFRMEYTAPDQGDIVVERTVRVPFGTFPKRCQFFRGDAMHLLASEGNGAAVPSPASRYDDVSWYQVPCDERFDGVLAANLLCRVPDPRKLLEVFPRLLHKGGV
ncbi:hypothetical protein DQ04_12601000, partial [Trypanosoma grayi]|uniref:hypothetical protein n=1 Tax=Trypanosoma grayi TaxID=71804 RepID=UPI0004F4365E